VGVEVCADHHQQMGSLGEFLKRRNRRVMLEAARVVPNLDTRGASSPQPMRSRAQRSADVRPGWGMMAPFTQ
jgi:hypothetical protein